MAERVRWYQGLHWRFFAVGALIAGGLGTGHGLLRLTGALAIDLGTVVLAANVITDVYRWIRRHVHA